MYSCSSRVGLVSSNRKWQRPENSCGDAEIERDRLGVADMQIAVRLRRKARHDPAVLFRVEIGLDDIADEIAACLCSLPVLPSFLFPVRGQPTFCQISPTEPSPLCEARL